MRPAFVLSLIAALSVATLVLAQTTKPADARATAARLRQVGQALLTYATDNRGYLPEQISTLAPKYIIPTTLLPESVTVPEGFSDWDEQKRAEFIERSTDIRYLGRQERVVKIREPAERAITMARDADDASLLCIGFADGHVETFRAVAPQPAP